MCLVNKHYLAILLLVVIKQNDAGFNNGKEKHHKAWMLLDSFECGESYSDRIIGGTTTALGQYPWAVLLGYTSIRDTEDRYKPVWLCGGSLITNRHVLTAAHCTFSANPDERLSWVRIGEYDRRSNPDCQKGVCAPPVQEIRIKRILTHKNYDRVWLYNDIAVLYLEHAVQFNDYVLPVCLPKKEQMEVKINEMLTVVGWGKTNLTTDARADILQEVQVPIVEKEICEKLLDLKKFKFTNREFCAGTHMNKDTCNGDSGGPIMKVFPTEEGPKTFLMGVVSFGPIKCGSIIPGVYTSVPYFINWILDQIVKY